MASPVLNNTDLIWDHVPGVPAGLDRKAQGGKRAPGRGQRHHSVRVTTANEKTKKHECIFLHKRVTEEIKNKLRV